MKLPVLLEKRFDDGIQSFGRAAFEANNAFLVEHENRGPLGDLVLLVNRTVDVAVPPAAPGEVFFLDHFLQFLAIFVAVDAQQGEGLIGMLLDERPLVRVQFPAGASPMPPKAEHHHFAAVIAELELPAIDVFPCNFRGDASHG